jgi:hypothetical protein
MRFEAITSGGVMGRRQLEPDPATGQQRFTGRAFRYRGYRTSDLAYAITGHSAQGATVHTGITLVTGSEDRHWLYPAMTRGTDTNIAFVVYHPLNRGPCARPPGTAWPRFPAGIQNPLPHVGGYSWRSKAAEGTIAALADLRAQAVACRATMTTTATAAAVNVITPTTVKRNFRSVSLAR